MFRKYLLNSTTIKLKHDKENNYITNLHDPTMDKFHQATGCRPGWSVSTRVERVDQSGTCQPGWRVILCLTSSGGGGGEMFQIVSDSKREDQRLQIPQDSAMTPGDRNSISSTHHSPRDEVLVVKGNTKLTSTW